MPNTTHLAIKEGSRHVVSPHSYESGSAVVDFGTGTSEVYVIIDTFNAAYGNVLISSFFDEADPKRAAQANEQLTVVPFTIESGVMTVRVLSNFGPYSGTLNLTWRIL